MSKSRGRILAMALRHRAGIYSTSIKVCMKKVCAVQCRVWSDHLPRVSRVGCESSSYCHAGTELDLLDLLEGCLGHRFQQSCYIKSQNGPLVIRGGVRDLDGDVALLNGNRLLVLGLMMSSQRKQDRECNRESMLTSVGLTYLCT